MNVLSLFDGMSCGQIALNKIAERQGIKSYTYYASEIDRTAISQTQRNFPNTIQLGDVSRINAKELPKIDLLIGGSPCQGFSFRGKQLNFEDPRSKLFFEFTRILKEHPPRFWLLENVVMRKDFEQVINECLKTEPVKINSGLVSAQNRERLYWSNFPITQPEDRNIKLIDILQDNEMIRGIPTSKHLLRKASILGRRINDKGKRDDYNKDIPIVQYLEVRGVNEDKSNCITTVAKDNVLTTMPVGRHPDAFKNNLPFRYYTQEEYCRLQTVPEDYFSDDTSPAQIRKMIGNGWTVDVIAHIFENMLSSSSSS
jgi:DNA (cytosine-5)-methyltransferase 3A